MSMLIIVLFVVFLVLLLYIGYRKKQIRLQEELEAKEERMRQKAKEEEEKEKRRHIQEEEARKASFLLQAQKVHKKETVLIVYPINIFTTSFFRKIYFEFFMKREFLRQEPCYSLYVEILYLHELYLKERIFFKVVSFPTEHKGYEKKTELFNLAKLSLEAFNLSYSHTHKLASLCAFFGFSENVKHFFGIDKECEGYKASAKIAEVLLRRLENVNERLNIVKLITSLADYRNKNIFVSIVDQAKENCESTLVTVEENSRVSEYISPAKTSKCVTKVETTLSMQESLLNKLLLQ